VLLVEFDASLIGYFLSLGGLNFVIELLYCFNHRDPNPKSSCFSVSAFQVIGEAEEVSLMT
jgi:hypothetical protein